MIVSVQNAFALTKPKITLLNLFVGITCFLLVGGSGINWAVLGIFSLLTYMAAGGCGVLNCYYDRDIDKKMERTSRRVLPMGRMSPQRVLILGFALLIVALVPSYLLLGQLTAVMISMGAIFYLVVYTLWLKRSSYINVVIGGAAGSFAALAGGAAAGAAFSPFPIIVSILDFLWTPGHIWALAIWNKSDYAKAGVPMLPVVLGSRRTSRYILAFNIATIFVSAMPIILGLSGIVYLGIAFTAGALLLRSSLGLIRDPSDSNAQSVFKISMPYLAILMAALILDSIMVTNFPYLGMKN